VRVLLPFLLLAATSCGENDGLRTRGFDPGPPSDKLALYIAINDYPLIEGGDLRGCVRDMARLRDIMRRRFGFERDMAVTNEDATRAGIAAAFQRLLAEARRAKSPRVLIAYAGHGSRVRDRAPGKDERDLMDETWVPHDSDLKGRNDIRDDDIFAVLSELRRLGAHVVLISDSCHSGSVFRSAEFARPRTLRSTGDAPRPGPEDDLFPDLAGDESGSGVVIYGACRDFEIAGEATDEDGRAFGRFSEALIDALRQAPKRTTYEQVFQRIASEFARRWPDARQTPQFKADPGVGARLFLDTEPAPEHARVLERTGEGVVVSMGHLHGVAKGATFEFFADLDALAEARGAIARGEVVTVDVATSVVDAKVPGTAVARLDDVRALDFGLLVPDPLPPPLDARLKEMAAGARLRLAKPGEPFSLALYVREGEALLYPPSRLPGDRMPQALYAFECDSASRFERHLAYLGRAQRLLNLDRNQGRLVVTLEVEGRTPETKDGIPELRDDETFRVAVRNRGRKPVYVTLFVFTPAAPGDPPYDFAHIFPESFGDDSLVGAGKTLGVELVATTPTERERTWIKAIATERSYDLRYLANRPEGRTRGTEERDELEKLLEDTVFGGPRTRGTGTRGTGIYWATGAIVFDVVK